MGWGTLVGKIFSAVLDPIDNLLDSILGSTETVIDAQVINILTPGEADRKAKKQSIRNSKGDLSAYAKQYRAYQRNYKQKFSAKFLSNLGYLPSSTATTKILNPTAVKDYVHTYDSNIVNVLQSFLKYMTEEEAAWDWMEDNIGWSNADKVAIYNGKTWGKLVITNNSTDIVMDLTRDPNETILSNLTTNFHYNPSDNTTELLTGPGTYKVTGTTGNGTTAIRIAINGNTFYTASIQEAEVYTISTPSKEAGSYTISVYETVDDIETLVSEKTVDIVATLEVYDVQSIDITDLGGFYRTTVILQSDGVTSVNIDTEIETMVRSIPSSTILTEKLVVTYNRGGREWYYYSENSAAIPSALYTQTPVDVTPIIPVKEDNVIFNENKQMERLLSKLNITRDSLLQSIENPSIDSAYLMMGIYPNTQDQAGIKAVFNTFDLMTSASGNVSITMSKLNMQYSFTIEKSVVNSKILPVNTYSNHTERIETPIGQVLAGETITTFVKTLIYQVTETQYKKLVISDYTQRYVISGQAIIATFDSPKDISRMILPLRVINSLRYKEFVPVYEDSLSLLVYAVEVVEVSWEESIAFATILKIAAVVLLVSTAGQAWEVSYDLWAAAEYATLVAFVVEVVGAAVVMHYAVATIMDYLVNTLGLDPALAAATILAAAYAGASFANVSFGQAQWLLLANNLIDESNNTIIEQIAEINADSEEYAKEMQEKNEHIMELLQTFDTGVVSMFNMSLTKEYSPYQIAAVFVDSKVNITDLDILLDVDWAVSSRLELE